MNYFPIFANLAGRPVLVVGGGAVAARKISLLLKAGAEVRVAAKHLNAELSALAAENKILWLAEEFRAEHIRTVFLIIAASSDQALNRRVFHLAESCQKPVNVVDDRDHCSFIFPSVIDRNPVQIAVSSSGSAPVLARLLRERLEALLPPSLGDMAEISGRWRDAVKGKLKSVTNAAAFGKSSLTDVSPPSSKTGKTPLPNGNWQSSWNKIIKAVLCLWSVRVPAMRGC